MPFSKNLILICAFVPFFISAHVFGAYYDTLPRGIRMAVFKQVRTSEIQSAFNRNKREQDYFFKIGLDAKSLASVNAQVNQAFSQLKSISPEAYEQFSFGEYQARGVGNVKVDGGGMAYGLSNRTTVYGTFSWYDAQVALDIQRTKGNNHAQVTKTLQKAGNSTGAELLSEITPQLFDVTGEVIQSFIVNSYGYEPLGDWQATGMGDMEIGVIHRLTDWTNSGLALSGGVVLPTGREDDPDMLQDFAFGDGQTDLFIEFGGGFRIPDTRWNFDAFSRYTYQFAHNRLMRVPESSEFTYGSESMVFEEKLGNMIDVVTKANYQFTSWFSLSSSLLFRSIGQSKYESTNSKANEIHSLNTNRTEQTLRAAAHFTTVPLYQSGDFFLPFLCNLEARRIVGGLNTPKFSRYDVEFRFFF